MKQTSLGWPLTAFLDADAAMGQLSVLSYAMLGLMVLSVLVALARDARAPDAWDGSRAWVPRQGSW